MEPNCPICGHSLNDFEPILYDFLPCSIDIQDDIQDDTQDI